MVKDSHHSFNPVHIVDHLQKRGYKAVNATTNQRGRHIQEIKSINRRNNMITEINNTAITASSQKA